MWRLARRLGLPLLVGATLALLEGSARADLQLDTELAGVIGTRLYGPGDRLTERGLRWVGGFSLDEEHFSARAQGRARWNDAYRTNDTYSPLARDAYQLALDWRELFLTVRVQEWRVSAGLQQVVWGRADQLRILDQVNPLSLREFVLPDLNDTRRPVPMLRLNGALGSWELELLYVPVFVPTQFALPGSEFFIPLVDAQTLAVAEVSPPRQPEPGWDSAELGVHATTTLGSADLELALFQTRDDDPVFASGVSLSEEGEPRYRLVPLYRRKLMLGAGLSLPTSGGLVLRSEASFVPNQTYTVPGAGDGLERSPTLTALLGLDYSYQDWLFAAQASERVIFSWREQYEAPERAPLFTLSATGNVLDAKLEARASIAVMPLNGDGVWLQLRPTYRPEDHWALTLGADLFAGDATGLFGQFQRKGRIRAELKYSF